MLFRRLYFMIKHYERKFILFLTIMFNCFLVNPMQWNYIYIYLECTYYG